jgi:phosphatidylserine decarboxylase
MACMRINGILNQNLVVRIRACKSVCVYIARRIFTYPIVGNLLKFGQRYGLIRFGSRVDIYLPLSCELAVTMGNKIFAGESVLGSMHGN